MNKDMTKACTGGCACGAIRFEIAGKPIFSNDCQTRCGQIQGRPLSPPQYGAVLAPRARQRRDTGRSACRP